MKRTTQRIVLLDYFSQFIKASVSGRRLTPPGKKISPGTIQNYCYVQKLLKEFETMYSISLTIQLLHRASMRMLQKEKNYWARFFLQFSAFLYTEKGYYDHYTGGVFKTLKTFFNYLQGDKGFSVGNYHKGFKIPLPAMTPVVLLPEQLRFLITDADFEKNLNPYLRRVKDIFVFGCTVGLRVSDLMSLKKTNIIYAGKEVYLKLITHKTGSEVKIPLPDYALQIADRYKRKAGKYILPRLSVSNLNIQVKKLIRKAGWTHVLPKCLSRRGKIIELKNKDNSSWRFHQHITAHTMRRTAITNLLILGVPELVVRKISGHAPGSNEFYKYVGIAQDYMNEEVKLAYKKLVELPADLKQQK